MKNIPLSLLIGAASALALQANAQVLVNETFDYANTAEMQAKWGSTGLGTLDTALGNPGSSATHPGGAVNIWAGSTFSLLPSAELSIRLSADIYDTAEGSAQRNTVGLRQAGGGATPLFEMGHYNSWSSQYGVRLVNSYGGLGWLQFPEVSRTAGWNRYEAIFTSTGVTVTLDIGADGTIDSTINALGSPAANAYADLRFGGPSNVTSAAPAWFDNILLQSIAVPEPSGFALGLLGGFALLVTRLRRK